VSTCCHKPQRSPAPGSAAQVAASNLRALRDGGTLVHVVDQQRGH